MYSPHVIEAILAITCAAGATIVSRCFPKVVQKEKIVTVTVEKAGAPVSPHVETLNTVNHLQDDAERCVTQVQEKFGTESGEFKAAQANRMMLNIHPAEKPHKLRLAVELAVHKCLGS